MKSALKASLAAVVMSLWLGSPALAQSCEASTFSPQTAAAARTVDLFHAALKAGRLDAASALLAPDLLVFEAGGREQSLKEYSAEHLPADAAYEARARETLLSRCGSSNGDLAWISSFGHVSSPLADRVVERQTTETMVLRRSGEDWIIVHVHWSSQTAKALD